MIKLTFKSAYGVQGYLKYSHLTQPNSNCQQQPVLYTRAHCHCVSETNQCTKTITHSTGVQAADMYSVHGMVFGFVTKRSKIDIIFRCTWLMINYFYILLIKHPCIFLCFNIFQSIRIQSHSIRKLNPMKSPSPPPQSDTRELRVWALSSLSTLILLLANRSWMFVSSTGLWPVFSGPSTI